MSHHHPPHEHHHECPCCGHECGCECSCCQEGGACETHQHHGHEHHDFASQLLEMADEAWMEVLKEKIKEHILTADGKNLDELAKLVSESNHARWKNKLATKDAVHDFHDKVEGFFKK